MHTGRPWVVKIALLVPGGVDRSGTRRSIPCLLALIERLTGQGDEVHVFTARQEAAPGEWTLLGATVRNAGRRPRGVRTLLSLWSEHRLAPFDVIHAFWASSGTVGAVASRLLGVPMVVTLAGGEVVDHGQIGYGGLGSFRGRLELRLAVKGAGQVTTPSDFMRELAAACGIAAQTVVLGVDLKRWPPLAPRARRGGGLLRILNVGGLKPVKGQTTLLEALAILHREGESFEAEIVGEGPLEGSLAEAAACMGLSHAVRLRPVMPHSELRQRFEWADLHVVSSVHESGSLVTLEAAVAGVPTVGTRVGHVADMAPSAAVAVPVMDAVALAADIRGLLHDDSERLRLAAAAQAYAARVDADATARTMRGIYHALAA
jgi:glycosyltransferase involved in cell wall biosynthesis